jgi:peptidoglycan hydrolase-like amidase
METGAEFHQGGFHALAAPGIYRSCSVVTEDGVRNAPDAPPYTFTPSNLFKYMFSNPPKDLVSAPRDPTLWSSVKWLYSFPLKDIEARLKQNHNIGKLKSIEAAKRTPHGRAQTLKFTGSRAVLELPFEEANFIIAAGTLRSPFFQIIPFTQKGEILFIGTDTGAGKGLCLEGAAGMARAENKTARQILKYYYPDLEPLEEWIEPKSL